MYGVNEIMSQTGSAHRIDRDKRDNRDISPELHEVLHMLDALERDSRAKKPQED